LKCGIFLRSIQIKREKKDINMKTVGIIGGIGPESTMEYYKFIISSFLQQEKSGNYPQIIINSINMKKMLDLIGANQLDQVARFLSGELEKVARAGADFALMASNTPHIVFENINKLSPLPLISIVEVTCDKTKALGLSRVGLFGTRFTMQGGFYDKVFSKNNILVMTPDQSDQAYIHEKYMGELVNGIIREDTRQELLAIAGKLMDNEGIEALVLGGTELPLILRETNDLNIPFLDTTQIHVEAVMKELI